MIHDLFLEGKPVLDDEKFASRQLGRFLTRLMLYGCDDNAEEWFDMVETRQKDVIRMHSFKNDVKRTS